MGVILQRPRLLGARLGLLAPCAVLTLSLIAACSLVKPVETSVDKQTRARTLASEGKHADAARAYAELAADMPADHDSYELLSAEQAAGDAGGKQALAAVGRRRKMPRAFWLRRIAVAEKHGGRHSRTGFDRRADVRRPRAELAAARQGAFLTGHPVEGTRARRASASAGSASLLPAARAVQQDPQRRRTQTAAEGPAADSVVAGCSWDVALELQRDPMHAAAALENWRRMFPQHPANDSVLELARSQIAVATEFPDQIALLLPLSGRAEAVGVAVRDGFIAAYLEQDPASRPRLRIYDVAAESVAGAYQQAIQDGAGFVVGPLTKEDVAAIVPLSAGRMPVLALNFLADGVNSPRNFYQFALLPEDEARIVARRLAADGKLTGVALVPDGEWGNRVSAAFADELTHLGGAVVDVGRYESGRADFSDVIKQTMQIHGVKGEPSTHRSDAVFVFVAGTPGAERLLVSQLKFHFAGDVPAYSPSDSFALDPGANGDLEGLFFPDMPWMVSADPVTGRIRDAVRGAWPARTARRDRLYAFGFDAYRLVPALRSNGLNGSSEISGVTGKLRLDDQNRIRRDLEWSQMKGGAPNPL
jgi:ABC-type branched-subunit amino acid transport system substrate-binding protein